MSRIQRSLTSQAGLLAKHAYSGSTEARPPPRPVLLPSPRLSTAGAGFPEKRTLRGHPAARTQERTILTPEHQHFLELRCVYGGVEVAGWWRSSLHLCQLPFHGLAAWSITPSALHSPASNTSGEHSSLFDRGLRNLPTGTCRQAWTGDALWPVILTRFFRGCWKPTLKFLQGGHLCAHSVGRLPIGRPSCCNTLPPWLDVFKIAGRVTDCMKKLQEQSEGGHSRLSLPGAEF